MKTIKRIEPCVCGILAAIALALTCMTSHAQPTNLFLYNFDTDQVSTTPWGTTWGNWFGANFISVVWDSSNDASNNPSSGSMMLTIDNLGTDQYVLNDGFVPSYAAVPLSTFTNLSFDMRYDISSAIRTNTTAAGVKDRVPRTSAICALAWWVVCRAL